MLILTRKCGEKIMIGDGIEITLLVAKSGQARIGITCDKSIPVHRKEIFDQIRKDIKTLEKGEE